MKPRSFLHVILAALLASFICIPAGTQQARRADLVNPLVGTSDDGQTFPAAGVPFAMTQWTPATRDGQLKGVAPYYYSDTTFRGFRGSHFLSGSATQDYGSVQIMMGQGSPDMSAGMPTTALSHALEHATPYVYSVRLPKLGVGASITGTTRCGALRLRFVHGGKSWILVENFALPNDGEVTVDEEHQEILSRSSVRRLYAGNGQPAGFSGYAVVEFDRPFQTGETWKREKPRVKGEEEGPQISNGAYVFFDVKPGAVVHVRVGTSFTSFAEARKNLRAEIPGWDFTKVMDRAASAWNRELDKIRVSGPLQDRQIFYTALYHSLLLPRVFSDVSGTYPKFGGGDAIENANGHLYYDDFSIWDTFRAVHPLFTVIEPQRESDMVQSLIAKGEQGGFLPIFPAWNSYTAEMDGDHADAIIADAWFKGLRGFDIASAYKLMRRNAFDSPSRDAYLDGKGRRGLRPYLQYGYIPLEEHIPDAMHKDEQVSRTLDYSYDDYLVGQVARSLGKTEDAAILAKRAQNYRNVFDPATGFVRGRYINGTWIAPFNPAKQSSYVTEGLPFQFTFFVPQDIPGLIHLEGGSAAFVAKLDQLFRRGLYDQGNEPSHQIAYLYDYAGAAAKTQEKIRSIVSTLYTDTPAGLPGNDDAGQMSAWYVFSALGFYPVTPGIPAYVIGTPHFAQAIIQLPNGKTFQIAAHNLSARNFYIRSVELNGGPLKRFWLEHSEIMRGGRLTFEMTDSPNASWPQSTEAPDGLDD